MQARWGIVLAVAAAALAAASRPARLSIATARARVAAGDPRHFVSQLSIEEVGGDAIASWLPPASPSEIASSLLDLSEGVSGDEAARLTGIAYFLADEPRQSVEALERVRTHNARDWNNLAAAHIALASKDAGEDGWITALAKLDRAAAIDPELIEAKFNRAAIIDHLGLAGVLSSPWRTYATAAGRSAWPHEQPAPSDREAWKAAASNAAPEALAALTHRYPEPARNDAETFQLAEWAEGKGDRPLERARIIGGVLQRELGETMAADAVAAIDRADANQLAHLRAGHIAYRDGRAAMAARHASDAEALFRTAQRELAAGGSPLAETAESFLAAAMNDGARIDDAHPIITRLLANIAPGHKAVAARLRLDLSLCEAQQGHWSASLASASAAVAGARQIRERGIAASAEAIVSQDYDFLGERDLALRHAANALRDACAAGMMSRPRPILAAMTRNEMRAQHWDRARAVARLERQLSAILKDPRLDADMLLQLAVIEHRAGNPSAAQASLNAARRSASPLEPTVRAKLMADIDGAAGTIARVTQPQTAVELLGSAIDYQTKARRPIMLPELHLQRGRAYLALGDTEGAARDFEAGIAELERQRSHVIDAALRPGLFDDAAELFDEAIALELRRGASTEAVLAYVERGRARALFEQIGGDVRSPVRIADIQQHLGPRAALVEYVSLPDRLAILVVTAKSASIRIVAVSRDALRRSPARYDVLIRPIEDVLRGVDAITFVADDVLQRVPFPALVDSGTFLIERFAIATAPSARVAVLTMERTYEGKPESLLVFANPTIPRDRYPNLRSLNVSEREAAWVAKQYAQPMMFKNDDATAERFLELAPQYDSVHFAGHANVEKAEPGASALVCASSPRVHGALTLRQIAAMRFTKTRVVVLAACSTMDGRNAAIEGVPSLARAFVIAGVPAVVGTLWDIDDAKAAPIMRVLHEELAKGAEPADALRTAQLAAIREGKPVEEWAAFAVTGVAR